MTLSSSVEAVTHIVIITLKGSRQVQRICEGSERSWKTNPGTVYFLPADGRRHVFLARAAEASEWLVFFLPRAQIDIVDTFPQTAPYASLKELVLSNDRELQSCIPSLAPSSTSASIDAASPKKAAAQRLLQRLRTLSGADRARSLPGVNAFDCHTLAWLVKQLDSRLTTPPSINELAAYTGLSTGYFATKFRNTTGLSPLRFLNLRRIQAALSTIRTTSLPMGAIAADLGFSSQSHFTRVFREYTGLTPARYRRQIAAAAA